jgi:hypothetical protein
MTGGGKLRVGCTFTGPSWGMCQIIELKTSKPAFRHLDYRRVLCRRGLTRVIAYFEAKGLE